MIRSLCLATTLLCAATSLVAAENCRTDGGPLPSLLPGTVAAPKLHFVKGGCGADPYAQGCELPAYLVEGDRVFIDVKRRNGALICVAYLGRGGSYTEGWMPFRSIIQGE
jgi:hypothetical protein